MDLKDHLEAATDPMHPRYPLLARIRGHLHVCTSLAVVAAAGVLASVAFGAPPNSTNSSPGNIPPSSNSPWYPSLQAFEHYDSGRSHVFSHGEVRRLLQRAEHAWTSSSSDDGAYPSGYNMSYLDHKNAFIQGGSYGDVQNSIGPFVAKFDPKTLKPVWFTQLRNTVRAGEWDYPGGMAIESDGYIYVVSGYRIFKVDPADGNVVDTLVLPTAVNMRNNYPSTPATYDTSLTDDAINTSYNGINALPDGTIVVKSLYRVAGCTLDGPSALISCPDSRNVPQSNLISVDPKTMQIIDDHHSAGIRGSPGRRITRYHGVDYVYLLENLSNAVRYAVDDGHLHPRYQLDAQRRSVCQPETGGSLIVMNDWIVGATNSVPATGALTVFAINQSDATKFLPAALRQRPDPAG